MIVQALSVTPSRVLNFSRLRLLTGFFVLYLLSPCTVWADPTVQITELDLTSSANYGMKHHDTGVQIQPPHWTSAGKREPVFYPVWKAVNVAATFELSEAYWSWVWVRASGTDGLLVGTTVLAPQPPVYTTLWLETQTIQSSGIMTGGEVGSDTLSFTWEYSLDGLDGPWHSAGTTSNDCYLVLDTPVSPWSSNGIDGFPVYVKMMELTCEFAGGTSTHDAALTQITQALNGWMTYDGDRHYTYPDKNSLFHIKSFLLDCSLASGPSNKNDCRDFANFLKCMTAANGESTIKIVVIDKHGSGFDTKWIKPANGSPVQAGWNYHQLNYKTWLGWWYMIDASLLLDQNDDEGDGFTPPGILANYDIGWSDYTNRLSDEPLTVRQTHNTVVLTESPRQ